MKSDFLKISGTLLSSRVLSSGILSLGILAMAVPWHVQAAKVNATLSWESGDYNSDYDYAGPRLDMNINPGGSNWYFDLGYRNRTHDTKQIYSRAELQTAYRFRFDGGWIQPSVKVRKDTTNYDSGSRMITDIYSTETKYQYDFSDRWGLWGELQFSLERQEDKNVSGTGTVRNSDYLAWELEPGIRYYTSSNSRLTLSYYNTGKRSDKGETWGVTDDRQGQQARLYYYWKTPIGLVVSPYIRYSLDYASASSWYKKTDNKSLGKLSRYALQLSYPISDALQLQVEYYLEELKLKDGFTMGKDDSQVKYLKLGVRAAF